MTAPVRPTNTDEILDLIEEEGAQGGMALFLSFTRGASNDFIATAKERWRKGANEPRFTIRLIHVQA
jgi:hypothetical protein